MNGNEFNGEWVAGLMSGRGTFVWSSGERYDGEWRDGKEEGRGTFTWPDGSYFDGNWVGGDKHGVGIWAPPVAADASATGAPRDAVLREYDRGSLVREELVPAQQRPVGDPVAGRPAVKTRKVREVRMGETIFKGAPSYDLMLQLQLGVRWSVGRITPERPRELSEQDYANNSPLATVSARFPRRGSSTTPPHASHDFKWKDYCPMVFRKLCERFGIDAGEYMLSLCGACAGCPRSDCFIAPSLTITPCVGRRHGASRALIAWQVWERVLLVAGRALHRQDDAQGRDGARFLLTRLALLGLPLTHCCRRTFAARCCETTMRT